jgi:hypothetical protein
MVYREGRLPRITVQHVAEKLVQWQRAYAPARLQALRDRGLTR